MQIDSDILIVRYFRMDARGDKKSFLRVGFLVADPPDNERVFDGFVMEKAVMGFDGPGIYSAKMDRDMKEKLVDGQAAAVIEYRIRELILVAKGTWGDLLTGEIKKPAGRGPQAVGSSKGVNA